MHVKELFYKALTKMLENREFDKIAQYPTTNEDRAYATILKDQIEEYIKAGNKIEDIPVIALISGIHSADVWANIFTYMLSLDGDNPREY